MQTALLYTTVEAVRACLGMDSADLPLENINVQSLKTQFVADLESWYPDDYVVDWQAAGYDPSIDANNEISKPTEAQMKGQRLSVYCMWYIAYRSVETLLAVTQRVSDGKNQLERFSSLNLENMLMRVRANLEDAKGEIIESLSTRTVRVLGPSRVESSTYDPVTNT